MVSNPRQTRGVSGATRTEEAGSAAADRKLCFICEGGHEEAEFGPDTYICQTCKFQALAEIRRTCE